MKKDKKGFIAEFKEFIMRGNVLDMAIGVIIATSFGAITKSLVDNIIMPLIGKLLGNIDLTKFDITIAEAVIENEVEVQPAVVLGIGTFIGTIIDFLIIAFVIFLVIKIFAKAKEISEAKLLKKKEEEEAEEAPAAPTTEELLTEILAEIRSKKE